MFGMIRLLQDVSAVRINHVRGTRPHYNDERIYGGQGQSENYCTASAPWYSIEANDKSGVSCCFVAIIWTVMNYYDGCHHCE